MTHTIRFIDGKPAVKLECNTFGNAVSRAVKQGVSLEGADLRNADLRYIDLIGANLCNANMLRADLRNVSLCRADLRNADLQHVNLCFADLNGAKLEGANLDFSCITLWCGTLNANVDKRLAVQLLYHACRWLQSVDDEECKEFLADQKVKALANQFHRVKECGEI